MLVLEKFPPKLPKAQLSPTLQPGHMTPQNPVPTLQDSRAPLVCCLTSSSLKPPPTYLCESSSALLPQELLSLLQTPRQPLSLAHAVPTQMPFPLLSGTSSPTNPSRYTRAVTPFLTCSLPCWCLSGAPVTADSVKLTGTCIPSTVPAH